MSKKKTVYILLTGFIVSILFVVSSRSIHKEKKKTPPIIQKASQNSKTEQNTSREVSTEAEKQHNKVMINMKLYMQENNYFCGPAVVKTILHHFGIDKTQNQLAKELHTSPTSGTEYADIAQVLNQAIFHRKNPGFQEGGYHVQTLPIQDDRPEEKRNWELRMRKNIDDGYPSILAIDMHTLYPQMKRVNHFIICVGYLTDQDNQILYFYILDPFYGVQDEIYGGLKYFTTNELWSASVENVEPAYLY